MKRDKYNRAIITTDWKGLDLTGYIIMNDWEGDPQVPRGLHNRGPVVDEFELVTPDGTDLFDYLTPAAEEEIVDLLIETSRGY